MIVKRLIALAGLVALLLPGLAARRHLREGGHVRLASS
jgi:hypothetical protein